MDKNVGLCFVFSGFQLSEHVDAMRDCLTKHGLREVRQWHVLLTHFGEREEIENPHYHVIKNSEFDHSYLLCSKQNEGLVVGAHTEALENLLTHHGLRLSSDLTITGSVYERDDLRICLGRISRRDTHTRKSVVMFELRNVRAFANAKKPFRVYVKDYFDLLFPDLHLKAEFEPTVERNWSCLQEATSSFGLSDVYYSEKHLCLSLLRLASH